MKKKLLMELVLVALYLSAWAEPGGSYTLTGEEKGIEEIIKADMAQYPDLYMSQCTQLSFRVQKDESNWQA